jgi:hypothetical protein
MFASVAWKHGASGYRTYRCRCPVCTKANTERARKERADRAARTPTVHNASTYSNWGCRCPECFADWSAKLKERRGSTPGDHGVIGYGRGCRCRVCKSAKSVADLKAAREGKPAPGSHSR